MQSMSVVQAGGGRLKQRPAKQLWVGGQSVSRMQPPGTVQVLLTQVRMSGQSASLPQRSQGKHRLATQLQLKEQSASALHVVGWQ